MARLELASSCAGACRSRKQDPRDRVDRGRAGVATDSE